MAKDNFKMPSNAAAWATGPGQALTVKSAPYIRPAAKEIVVQNYAVAINPLDWVLLTPLGAISFSWIKFPFIFGTDNAGEVVEVGSSVTRFKVGDRVVGLAGGTNEKPNKASHSSFQKYTVMDEHMTSPVPDTLSYEKAAVIPLGVSTAACGLFQKDQLALEYPTLPPSTAGNGKTLLIWGGSTSVGLNAIQLAVAVGYTVFTTCSPTNFPLVLSLGASKAFDYSSPTAIADLVAALQSHTLAGALSMGTGSIEACTAVLSRCKGNRFIVMATSPISQTPPEHFPVLRTIVGFVSWSIGHFFSGLRTGVKSKFIFGSSLIENEVGPLIFEQFLPKALAEGKYAAKPDPLVVGKGLEYMQEALDKQKKGVSAKKIVVTL